MKGKLKLNMNNVKTQKVKQIKLCNTKVEWHIFGKCNKDFYESIVDVEVGRNNKISVSLNYIGYQDEYMLNNFDREVYSSIVSLYLTGNKYITYSMIFNVLSGNDNKLKISNNNLELIRRSVNKMNETIITIEKSKLSKGFEYNEKLLPIELVDDIKLNGHEVEECFYIKEKEALPLFTLADNMSQVSTIEANLLNMRDKDGKIKLEINYENVILKYFLLRRILSSKNKKSKMKSICIFESLYEYINLEKYSGDNLRHKKKRILGNLQKCFECWKDMKLINNFNFNNKKVEWY